MCWCYTGCAGSLAQEQSAQYRAHFPSLLLFLSLLIKYAGKVEKKKKKSQICNHQCNFIGFVAPVLPPTVHSCAPQAIHRGVKTEFCQGQLMGVGDFTGPVMPASLSLVSDETETSPRLGFGRLSWISSASAVARQAHGKHKYFMDCQLRDVDRPCFS